MNDEIIYTVNVSNRQSLRCTWKCRVLIREEIRVKYKRAEVETIVLENEDIITASAHPCGHSSGSNACQINSNTPCGSSNSSWFDGDCIFGIGVCSKAAGPNSYEDPTDTI